MHKMLPWDFVVRPVGRGPGDHLPAGVHGDHSDGVVVAALAERGLLGQHAQGSVRTAARCRIRANVLKRINKY